MKYVLCCSESGKRKMARTSIRKKSLVQYPREGLGIDFIARRHELCDPVASFLLKLMPAAG